MTFEWPTLSAMAIFVVTVVGAIVRTTLVVNKANTVAANAKEQAENLNVSLAQTKMEVSQVRQELVSHQINVAEKYVSKSTHEASEGRILEAIHQVGRRIDEIFNGRQSN
jgi:hypothetical protein